MQRDQMKVNYPTYVNYESDEDEEMEEKKEPYSMSYGDIKYNESNSQDIRMKRDRRVEQSSSIIDISYQSESLSRYEESHQYNHNNQNKKDEIIQKIEYLSQQTLENYRPYLRRENFLQTYKAFMKYLDKLLATDFSYLFNRDENIMRFDENKNYSQKIQILSTQLKNAFSSKGLVDERSIYNYLLERSMNTPLLKLHGQLIFSDQLQHKVNQNSFKREYGYKMGKITYFDPDFFGQLQINLDKNNLILFSLKLHGFKDKLYLRVLMAMYKKLLRLIFMLEMIFNRVFGKCGKQLQFDVEFVFRYGVLSMKQEVLRQLEESCTFTLGQNKRIIFSYVEEVGFILKSNLKKEEGQSKVEDCNQNIRNEGEKHDKKEEEEEIEYFNNDDCDIFFSV